MYRGETTFRCPKCGKVFKGPDFEWSATTFTAPQPCPKCGTESKAIKNSLTGGLGWLIDEVKSWFGAEKKK